ncbi:MAG TPA: GntR family transcriptional regulator, partial [Candidatus Saccharimonadia bacterium]|nr:GntR family transcriptional regulator [Candidatus Saccharimonadia bacterium]
MRTPLPTQIASRMEARLRAGEWAPGSRLPPERELGRTFEVSRSTLRLALDELEERGLITRHQGRGTFVARVPVQADLGAYFSLRDALLARDIRLQTRVLEVAIVGASRGAAQELGLLPGDSVVRVDRLRSTEGEPLVIDSAYLPAAR